MAQNLDELAKKYDRAYQCLRCLHRDNIEKIDVKRRIEDHVTKYHLSLDQVGYYCRLCNFRCWEEKMLTGHLTSYSRHVRMAREQGLTTTDRTFLVSNAAPYQMGPADFCILSKEKSVDFFRTRAMAAKRPKSTSSSSPHNDLQELLDSFDVPYSSLVDQVAPSPIAADSKSTLTVPNGAAVETGPLDLSFIQIVPTENILPQLLDLGGSLLQTGEGTVPTINVRTGSVASTVTRPETEELVVTEPPLKRRRMETAHKRPSCSPSRSPPSSPASSASSSATINLTDGKELAESAMKPLVEAVNSNTRAIRVLGQNLERAMQSMEARITPSHSRSTQTSFRESRRDERASRSQERRQREDRRVVQNHRSRR